MRRKTIIEEDIRYYEFRASSCQANAVISDTEHERIFWQSQADKHNERVLKLKDMLEQEYK